MNETYNEKYDVFISYSRKDYVDENKIVISGNVVSKVKDALEKLNMRVWFDENGVYSGDEFAPLIARAIKNSEIFLFISSHNSNASDWTSNEIATAYLYKKKIIPFRIDDSIYNESIILYIAKRDYIDYTKNQEKAILRLEKSIKTHFAQKAIKKEQQKEQQQQEEERLKKAEQREKELLELQKELEPLTHAIQDLRHQLQVKSSRYNELKDKEAKLMGVSYEWTSNASGIDNQAINRINAPKRSKLNYYINNWKNWIQYKQSGKRRNTIEQIALIILSLIAALNTLIIALFLMIRLSHIFV